MLPVLVREPESKGLLPVLAYIQLDMTDVSHGRMGSNCSHLGDRMNPGIGIKCIFTGARPYVPSLQNLNPKP